MEFQIYPLEKKEHPNFVCLVGMVITENSPDDVLLKKYNSSPLCIFHEVKECNGTFSVKIGRYRKKNTLRKQKGR